MRLDVLIFTNEQAWLRKAEEAGEAEEAFFVGAGFTTNVSLSP